MSDWELAGVVFDGGAISLDGLNPWSYEWIDLNYTVNVPDPLHHNQIHNLRAYQITDQTKTVYFAAGEFSSGVWGFYLKACR